MSGKEVEVEMNDYLVSYNGIVGELSIDQLVPNWLSIGKLIIQSYTWKN